MGKASLIEVTVDNPMNLRAFPFDEDEIKITFYQVDGDSSDDYCYVAHEPADGCVQTFFPHDTVTEFDITGFSTESFTYTTGFKGTVFQVHFHLRRRSIYYIWKVVFPLFLSTVFSFTSFLYHKDEIADRNNTALTMFLATVAILFVVGSSLPKVPYLTQIDKYVLISLVTQFLVALSAWVVYGGFGELGPDEADWLDTASKAAIPGLYVLATAGLFARAVYIACTRKPNDPPRHALQSAAPSDGTATRITPPEFHPFRAREFPVLVDY